MEKTSAGRMRPRHMAPEVKMSNRSKSAESAIARQPWRKTPGLQAITSYAVTPLDQGDAVHTWRNLKSHRRMAVFGGKADTAIALSGHSLLQRDTGTLVLSRDSAAGYDIAYDVLRRRGPSRASLRGWIATYRLKRKWLSVIGGIE